MAFTDPGKGRIVVDSGCGTEPAKVTLAENCKCGDVLGYSSGWKRALATTSSVIQGRLVALTDGENGDEIPVSACPVIKGYTGATPGSYIYVAESTDYGKITQTVPVTAGDATTVIGVAVSDTEVLFFLNSRADSSQRFLPARTVTEDVTGLTGFGKCYFDQSFTLLNNPSHTRV